MEYLMLIISILTYIFLFGLFLGAFKDEDTGKVSGFVIIPIIIPVIGGLYYFTPYSEEIELVLFFLLRIIAGTFVLLFSIVLTIPKNVKLSKEKEDSNMILIIVMSLVSTIIINYFFGDNIILFLKNNWYYFLAGFLVVGLISSFVENFKEKTAK
jgi:hypothetical protein